MISNYETPLWAANGWLVNLQPYADETPGYDPNDFIPTVRDSLSYQGDLYSVPFYGESSFLIYRKDLFEQAGLTMPDRPTWQQVADFAAKLDQPEENRVGICLRGLAGWGENLAPLDTVINTFGGRWFDMNWNAQLNSPESSAAIKFYVDLVRQHGEPGPRPPASPTARRATARARPPCGTTPRRWSAWSSRRRTRPWPGRTATPRPRWCRTKNSGWLYSWSLAIPKTSKQGRHGVGVHVLDDEQGLHEAGRQGARLGTGPARQPPVDVPDPPVRRGGAGLSRSRR